MERFQNNYITFYESVSSIVSPDFWEANKPILPETNDEQINLFVVNWYPHMKEVSNVNLIYFKDNKINPFIFQNLKFLDLIEQLNLKNQNVVWEYLHSLYALSITNTYIQNKVNSDTNEDKELKILIQAIIKDYPEHISNMVSWRKDLLKKNQSDDKEQVKSEEPKIPIFDNIFLENSSLAKLAKEISEEINPSDILNVENDMKNMDNPMKLLQSLMSGQENGVGKLMTTVCDKIKNKMETGQINQAELFKEATTLMQNISSLTPDKNGNNKSSNGEPDLQSMMSMFQNLSSMSDIFNGPSSNSYNSSNSSHKKGKKYKKRVGKKINKSNKNDTIKK